MLANGHGNITGDVVASLPCILKVRKNSYEDDGDDDGDGDGDGEGDQVTLLGMVDTETSA